MKTKHNLSARWTHAESEHIAVGRTIHADISWAPRTTHFKRPEVPGRCLTKSAPITDKAKCVITPVHYPHAPATSVMPYITPTPKHDVHDEVRHTLNVSSFMEQLVRNQFDPTLADASVEFICQG